MKTDKPFHQPSKAGSFERHILTAFLIILPFLLFTACSDNGTSVEFDGVTTESTGNAGDPIDLKSVINDDGTNTVLSRDSSDENATATIVFDISSSSEALGDTFSVSEFESGTQVDIVITTASGTQAETSFIIESPLDPQLSEGDEIRLD